MRLGTSLAAAAAGLLLVAGVAIAQGPPPGEPVAADLQAPRGITALADGGLLIAEQGSGSILRVAPDGEITTAVEGLPTAIADTPEGPQPAGPTAVITTGDAYYIVTGEAVEDGLQTLWRADTDGLETIADLGAYEDENNTDGIEAEDGTPEVNSNPFSLEFDPGGNGVVVTDSGANAVLHVTPDGEISPYAIFPPRENDTGVGPPFFQQVPTGTTIGPDGALYVTTLTGFPFPTGQAVVYRIAEAGAAEVFASGFTTATDVAFDADGSLLVTEFSTDMAAQAPGRLVRWTDGQISVVQDGLISPTSLAVRDGAIVVTQEFAGLVSALVVTTDGDTAPDDDADADDNAAADDEAAADDAAADDAAAEEETATAQPVVLPTTGSGGLADQDGGGIGATAIALIAAAASVVAIVAMSVSRRRRLR